MYIPPETSFKESHHSKIPFLNIIWPILPEKEMLNPCSEIEKSEMKRSWALKFPYRPALTVAGLSEPVSRASG